MAAHARIAIVVALGALVFAHARTFPFSTEDSTLVEKAPGMALTTPSLGSPQPVTVMSLALNQRLTGIDAKAYRVVNIALHLGNVVLVYLLLLRLGVATATAASAASLLCLHPLVAEPVCRVIGRADLLAAGFLLASLLQIAGRRGDETPAQPWRWAGTLVLAIAAMLSAPSGIVAGGFLFVFIRLVQPGWPWRRVALALSPLAAVAVVIAALSPRIRIADATDVVRTFGLHAQHFIWPRGLAHEYARAGDDPWKSVVILSLAAAAGLVVWTLRRTAPRSTERAVLLFLAIAYLPACGILEPQRWAADSHLYLPLVGVVVGLATMGARFWPGLAGFPALAGALAVLTYYQAETWAR